MFRWSTLQSGLLTNGAIDVYSRQYQQLDMRDARNSRETSWRLAVYLVYSETTAPCSYRSDGPEQAACSRLTFVPRDHIAVSLRQNTGVRAWPYHLRSAGT